MQQPAPTSEPEPLPPAYLRMPTIRGDTVVFVSDDDLWRVGADGGVAVRLTAGLSEPATPQLSPCGRWLAFAGRDEQHAEVWVMPAAGGAARRLTWLGADLAVRGFLPDGRIVFCSNHGQPFVRHVHAFAVPVDGGVPQALALGPVDHLACGPGSARVIGRNTADPARWKRYRGGRAGHLWVDADGAGRWRRMAELPGNITSPMWLGDRIAFLSDAEGIGNLYACRPDGSGLARQTDHADFYARHAGTDGRRVVYQCGAALWLFDAESGRTRPIDVQVPSARTQAARRFAPAAEHLQGVRLHPAGHSVALEARGQCFTMALWEGAVRRHGGGSGMRRRFGQWLADGRTLLAVSDAGGEERIELDDPGSDRPRSLPWDIGRATAVVAAPVGTHVAMGNHRNELLLGDTATGSLRRLDHSPFGRLDDIAWSPDGAWLAYTAPMSPRHTAIRLLEVATGVVTLVTRPDFRDYAPAFDPGGKYLYFLSLRTYDPVYDSVQFALSFPRAARPYLIALQAGGPAPFDPAPRGMAKPPDGVDTDAATAAPAAVSVELAGIERRVTAFPVPEARFGQISGVAGGRVVWTVLPVAGAHGRGGHKDDPGRLEVFDFGTGTAATLVEQADSFVVAADHHTLLVRHAKTLRVLDAAQPPDADAGKKAPAEDKPSRRNGRLDLARVRLGIDPPAEWAQMLHELWRLQRDHFWVADMSGIDWNAVLARYAPLLARVATRGEFSDLAWELQGELGTSHAYEMGGDHRKPPAVALGHLLADFRPTHSDAGAGGTIAVTRDGEASAVAPAAGWEITRLVEGDPWDAMATSPLCAVGVEAVVGERIVAIGGQALGPHDPPASRLVHHAGERVALTIASADGSRRREVVATALADPLPALYRAWVEHRRAWVHAHSGGRVGYLHLPDMMAAGFAEFHRYFGTECDRDGLIVDLRFNRGGHVSQLLLEKVARKRIAWSTTRWGEPTSYPEEAAAGPVVALTNEHAGSDGDIFSHNFKLMGIGELVGMRTWGGVIGIWPRHALIDGTETTQPEYAYWFKDVGWAVENFGTEPTIEVDVAPHDATDRQLEVALQTALQAIERDGVARPAFGPRPVLTTPVLPARRAPDEGL